MFKSRLCWLCLKPLNVATKRCKRLIQVNAIKQQSVLQKKSSTFRIFCVDSTGTRNVYDVGKTTLYNELGLTVRDLRFQHSHMLISRNRHIIIRFQKLKAIICSDAVFLVDPPFDSNVEDVEKDNEVATFWKDLPIFLTGSVLYTHNLPLEYRALEGILTSTLCNLTYNLAKLEPEIKKLLSELTDPSNMEVDRSRVHVLLKHSASLNTFSTYVREFCEMIEEILQCEDDVRDLCISVNIGDNASRSDYDAFIFKPFEEGFDQSEEGKEFSKKKGKFNLNMNPTKNYAHQQYKLNLQDEMETLLDSFLKDAEEIANQVSELKEAIENSNTAILINLDSHRNFLLQLELRLTMGMFSCTFFGMLGMAFGMNLESTLEEIPAIFWSVTSVMFVGAGVMCWQLNKLLRRPHMNSMFTYPNKLRPDPSTSTKSTPNSENLFKSNAEDIFMDKKLPLPKSISSFQSIIKFGDKLPIGSDIGSRKILPKVENEDGVFYQEAVKYNYVSKLRNNDNHLINRHGIPNRMKPLNEPIGGRDWFKLIRPQHKRMFSNY